MNLYAQPNGIVVGNDLYRIIRSFKQLDDAYRFHEMDSYYCGAGKYYTPLFTFKNEADKRSTCKSSKLLFA